MRLGKRDVLAVVALLVVVVSVYAATLRPGHDWGGDFSQYIAHARNIAEGRPYFETKYRPIPVDAAVHMPASYPPLFPLLIAPVYAHYGLNYVALKMVPQALFVLAALALYALFRVMGAREFEAACAAGAIPLSGLVLSFKDSVVSDSTYLFLATLVLLAALWVERNAWHLTRPLPAAAMVLAPMLLAYTSRAIGFSLALAFSVHALLRYPKAWRFWLPVAAGFAAGVAILSVTLYDSRAYGNQFGIDLAAYWNNALGYLRSPSSLWAGSPAWVRWPMLAATLPLALWEYARRLRKERSMVEIYAAAVVAPVILYSSGFSARYLLPVLPFYVFYFGQAALRLPIPRSATIACTLLALSSAFNVRGMEKGPYKEGVEMPEFQRAVEWIRTNTPPDATVVSWNPRVLTLYTDRPTTWYPQRQAEVTPFLRSLPQGSYALIYRSIPEDISLLATAVDSTAAFSFGPFTITRIGIRSNR